MNKTILKLIINTAFKHPDRYDVTYDVYYDAEDTSSKPHAYIHNLCVWDKSSVTICLTLKLDDKLLKHLLNTYSFFDRGVFETSDGFYRVYSYDVKPCFVMQPVGYGVVPEDLPGVIPRR